MTSTPPFSRRGIILAGGIAAMLGGCAAPGGADGYPSLARRPVERVLTVEAAPPPPPPAAASGALASQLAALSSRRDAAATRFAALRDDAARAVASASGAAAASEAWIAAQQSISALDAARSDATVVLADLDRLTITRTDAGEFDGLPETVALRDAVAAMVQQQDQLLAGLAARLRQP